MGAGRSGVRGTHHSITPSLHHSITPSLHHSITPSLHHSITPSLHIFVRACANEDASTADDGEAEVQVEPRGGGGSRGAPVGNERGRRGRRDRRGTRTRYRAARR